MITRPWFALVVGALIAMPIVSQAQGRTGVGVGLAATTLAASHEHLADPLSGWIGRIDVPVGARRYSIRVTAEQTTGSRNGRIGNVCGCFGPPGGIQERLHDDAELLTLGLGVGRRVVGGPRTTATVLVNLQHALARGTTTGQTSGDVAERERRLFGGEVGVEGAIAPWSRLPLALEVGASLGALRPLVIEEILDAPSAFNGVIGIARLRIGVSFRMR